MFYANKFHLFCATFASCICVYLCLSLSLYVCVATSRRRIVLSSQDSKRIFYEVLKYNRIVMNVCLWSRGNTPEKSSTGKGFIKGGGRTQVAKKFDGTHNE